MAGIEVYEPVLRLTNEFNYQGSVLVEIKDEPAGIIQKYSLIIAARTGAANASGEPVFRVVTEEDSAETQLAVLHRAFEYPLSRVYPQTSVGITLAESIDEKDAKHGLPEFVKDFINEKTRSGKKPAKKTAKIKSAPLVILPVFPGTNCEWDMEYAFKEAGAKTKLVIFRNQNQDDIKDSLAELEKAINGSQIIALSGGFSAGDEPDGSGKFIANVLRSPSISGALIKFLENSGLLLGICNGFQALIKTGLLPCGKFTDSKPTLTYNTLGRHISRMVRTRVMSDSSPWLAFDETGTIHKIPISHGEGRIVIAKEEAKKLFDAGQVPFCYADAEGNPAMSEPDNPNGSDFGIEGLSSPDGHILGKMGHSERAGKFVHVNIPGNKIQNIFKAGVAYFK